MTGSPQTGKVDQHAALRGGGGGGGIQLIQYTDNIEQIEIVAVHGCARNCKQSLQTLRVRSLTGICA